MEHGTKAIMPSNLEGLSKAPQPIDSRTVGQTMSFLRMKGFSSEWIENYAIKTPPMRTLMTEAWTRTLNVEIIWTADACVTF